MTTHPHNQAQINRLNKILRQELGASPAGGGLYQWMWSEDWTRSKRVLEAKDDGTLVPLWEHVKDPESGLFKAIPVYVQEKVVPYADHQWLMGFWMDPNSFEEFRKLYGDSLEWSKAGEYWPVTVADHRGTMPIVSLAPFKQPTDDDTYAFIRVRRKDRTTVLEFEDMMAKRILARQAAERDRLTGVIYDKLGAFGGIPGSRAFGVQAQFGRGMDTRILDPFGKEIKH